MYAKIVSKGVCMKIGIVGAGISGLTASHYLSKIFDHVDLYEANKYLGGHTNTVDVTNAQQQTQPVDTGFIVFNDRTYPNFMRLLAELKVAFQKSEMSFGIKHEPTGLEFRGANLGGLFAQRRNILSLRHIKFLYEIARFNKLASRIREEIPHEMTISQFFRKFPFRKELLEYFILPMGAAIWSTSCEQFTDFPVKFVLDFYSHHGLLSLNDRPQWFTITNGSRSYVERLTERSSATFRIESPVRSVTRSPKGKVAIEAADRQVIEYDHVVIATHPDQALKIIKNPKPAEQEVLGAFRYESNLAILHTDTSILPNTKRAWASWNYLVEERKELKASVTYWMNNLQSIEGDTQYLVTLNAEHRIKPDKIIRKIQYEHPQFDEKKHQISQRHEELINLEGISYCGAYWGAGFHEDGVRSSIKAINHLLSDNHVSILEPNYG